MEIINLKAHFPSKDGLVKAVDSVDLNLERGERLGLIGETGCGKTVLGMSLVRLLQPSTRIEGQIIYKGRDILGLSEDEMRKLRGKEMAMILQNPTTSLNPVLKVGDQIAEAVRLHQGLGRREAQARAVEMLEAVKIPEAARWANHYPHQLSGGMKERVMIAMGLACDPHLVIADEPTKGLDMGTKAQIAALMKSATERKSMIMITHDLGVAGDICDRIAVMYAGELLEVASSESILKHPLHPYTVGFISSMPSRGLWPIRGSSPSLIDPPQGCRFHPRCDKATEACRRTHPDLVSVKPDHQVRCLLWN